MYGYFRLPINSKKEEKIIFRNCMCNLCNSLHREYGIRARIFVNYDSTLLSLIEYLLKNKELLSEKKPKFFPCLKKLAPNTEFQKFVSAITIMLSYCRKYDNIIDNDEDPSMICWFSNYVDKASSFLTPYGLSKSFFESQLIIQHNNESLSIDLETLSMPTQEILGRIFFNLSHLIESGENQREWELLGRDIGFLIYIYDGIYDFHADIESGNFNCINSQFSLKKNSYNEVNKDIELIIERKKMEIYNRLFKLEKGYNLDLLKKILLNSPFSNNNYIENGKVSCKLSKIQKINNIYKKLQSRLFYVLIGGSMVPQIASASTNNDPCMSCCSCCAQGSLNAYYFCLYGTTDGTVGDECNCTGCSCRCCFCCCIPMFICNWLCDN